MIQCVCKKLETSGMPCNMVVNYHAPITLEIVERCPPFHNMPLLDGEHKHEWKITEIKFGK